MALTKAELYAELRKPEPGMKPFTKVAGSRSINLAPSLTHSGGGREYKRGGMEYAIASLPEVTQLVVRSVAQKALYRASNILGNIRTAAFSFGDIRDHWVQLSLQKGRIDAYLVLTDTKAGQKGAMSIEFGRDPYYLERPDGSTVKVGAMTGKFILHRAFGVPPNSLQGTGGGDIA